MPHPIPFPCPYLSSCLLVLVFSFHGTVIHAPPRPIPIPISLLMSACPCVVLPCNGNTCLLVLVLSFHGTVTHAPPHPFPVPIPFPCPYLFSCLLVLVFSFHGTVTHAPPHPIPIPISLHMSAYPCVLLPWNGNTCPTPPHPHPHISSHVCLSLCSPSMAR